MRKSGKMVMHVTREDLKERDWHLFDVVKVPFGERQEIEARITAWVEDETGFVITLMPTALEESVFK